MSMEASVGRWRLSRMSRSACSDITLAKLEDYKVSGISAAALMEAVENFC